MSDTDRSEGPDLSRESAQWWRALRERDLERVRTSGTTAAPATGNASGAVITTAGARTGLPRAVPVIRFEHDGVGAGAGEGGQQ
jgi:hypothetical protein